MPYFSFTFLYIIYIIYYLIIYLYIYTYIFIIIITSHIWEVIVVMTVLRFWRIYTFWTPGYEKVVFGTPSAVHVYVCMCVCVCMYVCLISAWLSGQIIFLPGILCPVNKYILTPKLGAFQMSPETQWRLSIKRVFWF